MVVRIAERFPTVDQVAIKYQNPPGSNMTFTQLDYALNGYGMDGIHKRPYYARDISTAIMEGKPVIALVWYQSLPQKFSTFNGSHFIAVYGTNGESLLYRDPLANNGDELRITFAQLDKAMSDVIQGNNYPNQAMDCIAK